MATHLPRAAEQDGKTLSHTLVSVQHLVSCLGQRCNLMNTCVLKTSGFVKADQCYRSGFRFTLCPIIPRLCDWFKVWSVHSLRWMVRPKRERVFGHLVCVVVSSTCTSSFATAPVTISRAISYSAMSSMICTAAEEYISVPVKAASGVEVVCMSVSSSSEGSSTFLILVQREDFTLLFFIQLLHSSGTVDVPEMIPLHLNNARAFSLLFKMIHLEKIGPVPFR